MKKLLLLAHFLLFSQILYSQGIKGKILEATTSEPLIGATVKIIGTSLGAVADVDGNYFIGDLKPGVYELKFSYIGYNDKNFQSVVVKDGEVTNLDVVLTVDGLTTEVITIEANTSLSNEQAMLTEKKNSDKISDGISEQQIKRAPDAAASDVMKRIIGVNIVDNKFVFIRGTSERYNTTTLNGVFLPSTETDKKSFSFDIFPSNLLENIIISKSYTPDQPGNFSGGLVQLNTKDFPESFTLNFSSSISGNSNTTGKDILTYPGEQKSVLFLNTGFDNGLRELPGSISSQMVSRDYYNGQSLKNFGRSFNSNWGIFGEKAPVNGSFQLSAGNNYRFGKSNQLGIFGAYTYSSSFSNKDLTRTEYQADGLKEQEFSGQNSMYKVQWGAIFNASFKLGDNQKLSLKNTYILNSEDETQYLEGTHIPQTADRKLYSTHMKVRGVYSAQLIGEHFFENLKRMKIDWKASYSESAADEPDYKTMIYQRENGTEDAYIAPISVTGNPNTTIGGRLFTNLKDINRSFEINTELPAKITDKIKMKIKTGVFAFGTQRHFNARLFAPYFSNQANIWDKSKIQKQSIDSIFSAINIDTNKLVFEEFTTGSDNYYAYENSYAGYIMFDVPIGKFRIITGARLESNEQVLKSIDLTNKPITVNLKNNDILPSLNLVYNVTENTNARFSYFQSISKPELREIAPFGFNDFNRNVFVYGNPYDLHRTLVRNFDLRLETYPEAGELMSISLFYKKLDAPIETVYLSEGSDSKSNTFRNATNGAVNYGVELELRKNLGSFTKYLNNFMFNGNLTIINSKIDLSGLSSAETKQERKMQGQSPYTINVGIYYDNSETGTSVNLLYNRYGSRISEVGLSGFGDIEEVGRDLVDFSASQKFLGNFEAKFTVRNLLGKDIYYSQLVNSTSETVRYYRVGTNYSFSLGYKF
ncbi:MAG: TonB-dependent receptor [Ignavibacteriae bacterium]|nr:TonB-dependent receptor [Ignavibacteriota bacterium]